MAIYKRETVLFNKLSRLHASIKSLASENKKFDVMFVEAVGVLVNNVIEECFAVWTQVTRRFDGSVRVIFSFG